MVKHQVQRTWFCLKIGYPQKPFDSLVLFLVILVLNFIFCCMFMYVYVCLSMFILLLYKCIYFEHVSPHLSSIFINIPLNSPLPSNKKESQASGSLRTTICGTECPAWPMGFTGCANKPSRNTSGPMCAGLGCWGRE